MPTNAEARLRSRLYGGANYVGNTTDARAFADLPEWLRRQYEQQTSGSDAGSESSYFGPGAVVRDAQGREVLLLNDDGSSSHDDRQINEGAESNRRFDEDLGWVTDLANTNEEKFKERMRRNRAIALSVIGGMAAAGAGGLLGAGAGEAGMVAGAGEGLAATIPADLAVGGGAAAPGYTLAEIPAIVGGGGAAAGGGAGGLAALGEAAGGGGMAATIPGDIAMNTAVGSSTALDAMPAIQAAGGGSSGIGRIVQGMGGAQNIARLGLAGLGAATSSGGGGGGGETNPQSIIEQMAQANRVDHNTPIGSRRWSQDPATGRWTVNDTMSDIEAANFGQVQGMNADVTRMGRDRLAALLAAPARQRYDRPLGT